jgi:hypothetical protein
LHGIVAVTELVAAARVAGWRDEAQQKRFFDGVTQLAEEVPLWRLFMPTLAQPEAVTHAALLDALGPELH